MDACGTTHLCHAADGFLHLLGGNQHQVCQLVDDHHHGGQLLKTLFLAALYKGVEARQILHATLREHLVALHHLKDGPLQRTRRLLRVGDHGNQQMGDAVIGGKLHHLGVHHDKADFLGGGLVEKAHN